MFFGIINTKSLKMKISFFTKVKNKEILDVVGFYKEDIETLKMIDSDMEICTSRKDINFFKSDVLFIWWWIYAFIPVLIARLLGKKVIITGTFNYDKNIERKKGFLHRPKWQQILIKFATKFASYNSLVSEREYEELTNDWDLKNTVYCPYLVDTDKYSFSKNRNIKTLITICQLSKNNIKRKKIFELIGAFSALDKNGYKLILDSICL